jgi:hypothetical protein
MAAIISTTPMMLKTWLPVRLMLMTAKYVALDSILVDVAPPRGTVVGMFEIVIKNANTPTDRIINATTALIIWFAQRSIFFL